MKLIVNRAPDGKLSDGILEEIQLQELDLAGVLPHDEDVYEFDCEGKPTVQLPKESRMRVELEKILDSLEL